MKGNIQSLNAKVGYDIIMLGNFNYVSPITEKIIHSKS